MINNTIHVLLVEDNPGDASLIKEMFKDIPKIHFKIVHTIRLQDAINIINAPKGVEGSSLEKIDIVLLDLQLPDSDGIETFNRMNSIAPEIPIIILTGLEDEEFAIEIVGEGAQDYLVKGQFDSRLLARSINYSIERKQIERKLTESEEKYRLMVEKTHSGVFFVNSKNELSYVNKQMAKMLGFRVSEMINKNISNFTNPEGDNCFREHLDNMRHGTEIRKKLAQTYELEFLNRNGSSLWVLVSTNPLYNQKGEYLGAISIMTDISSRKGIEKSLIDTMIEKDRDFFLIMANMVEAMKPLIQKNHIVEGHQFNVYKDKFT
ncbi:MAG: PAS domain S-box protein [Methanobacteriaceae archaeon]|nr:PAS domain S-box protein [Methanobacteriaceae archaeon]